MLPLPYTPKPSLQSTPSKKKPKKMIVFGSGLAIVLSLVFGCLLLALIGELYYLLWWKNRLNNATNASTTNSVSNGQDALDNGKDGGGVEAELLRLQNRLLFTISEETKEDLESEAGKSSRKGSRTKSLSDFIVAVDESPVKSTGEFRGFNPLFESGEVDGLRCCSPPPKMKFLRDAEEKMKRRLVEEGGGRSGFESLGDEELGEGSFVRIVFGRNSQRFGGH